MVKKYNQELNTAESARSSFAESAAIKIEGNKKDRRTEKNKVYDQILL